MDTDVDNDIERPYPIVKIREDGEWQCPYCGCWNSVGSKQEILVDCECCWETCTTLEED